jgi:hypothetical protein
VDRLQLGVDSDEELRREAVAAWEKKSMLGRCGGR